MLTVDPGDTVRFSTLDGGWGLEPMDPGGRPRRQFEPREPELDSGHALVGPIEVRGARAGGTLALRIDEVRVGTYGYTTAGGYPTALNKPRRCQRRRPGRRLGARRRRRRRRDRNGHVVRLRPFLGVLGMPPPEPGIHPTPPPRRFGSNIDCGELVAGTTLFLPIPVDGALLSAGDGHARQGDGEVSQLAIECPFERVALTLDLRDDLRLEWPAARSDDAWITFGFDEDLEEAAAIATEGMLELMGREYGLERRDALALAGVVVDLRVTQLVNGARGVHAVLRDDAVAFHA